MKYKTLKQTHVKERIKINGIEIILMKTLLAIKVNGKTLFHTLSKILEK